MGASLERQMKNYIDAWKPASDEFKRQLKATELGERHRLLMEVRGEMYRSDTCVIVGAHLRDLPALKCMLDGMNQEEKFNILKIANSTDVAALHSAVNEQRDHPYSTEVAKELTNNLSTKQLYQLLQMKTKPSEYTVLHYAVYYNRVDFVAHMLTQLTWEQKGKLLSIRNAKGATPADLSVTTIFSTVQGLREVQQKIQSVNGELVKQGGVQNQLSDRYKQIAAQQAKGLEETKKELADVQKSNIELVGELLRRNMLLERDNNQQTQALQDTSDELKSSQRQIDRLQERNDEQEQVIAEQTRQLTAQRRDIDEMKVLLHYLEKSLGTPIVTDATGDQEVEDY